MEEEVRGSLDYRQDIEILGRTGDVPSVTGTIVTPIVAALHRNFRDTDDFHQVFHNPCEAEVEKVFFRTVKDLCSSETSEVLERFKERESPLFPGVDGNIWGLTAVILRPILHEVLIPVFHRRNNPRNRL
mmetsp:Transcript_17151/g.19720  ORF Transcript_17151/g.19720 Transcript_17151/m.19720 type:complete len:130 (-) Transcript_17151:133-522(-)